MIDCFNKEVIGWADADNYTTPLIEEAIAMATKKNRIHPKVVFPSGAYVTATTTHPNGGIP